MEQNNIHDWIGNQEVPPLVINEDFALSGLHQGSVVLKSGRFTLEGIIQGTLDIGPMVTANINGSQQGSVIIGEKAMVIVKGNIEGTTSVLPEATLIIEASGRLAGTLINNGIVIVRGVFGGTQLGECKIQIEGNGYIKEPTIRNGFEYYEW